MTSTAAKATERSGGTEGEGFSTEERAAMRDRAKETKRAGRRSPGQARAEGERELLAKVAEMAPADREIAERLHAIVGACAPGLVPRTWYGMPAYADERGKVVCFLQSAQRFKTRYATLGFSDTAALDEGDMWPTAFALKRLTDAEAAQITALITRAIG